MYSQKPGKHDNLENMVEEHEVIVWSLTHTNVIHYIGTTLYLTTVLKLRGAMKAPLDLTRTAIRKKTFTEFPFKRARIKLMLLALIKLKCAEQNSRQIGRAAISALFVVTRNRVSEQRKK